MSRRNPAPLATLLWGALAVGGAVVVFRMAGARAARKDLAAVLGLPPGAFVRQATAAEEAVALGAEGIAHRDALIQSVGPYGGLWIIRRQFAEEPTYSKDLPGGGFVFIIEEGAFADKLGGKAGGAAPPAKIAGFQW